jgi:hypothetical protein
MEPEIEVTMTMIEAGVRLLEFESAIDFATIARDCYRAMERVRRAEARARPAESMWRYEALARYGYRSASEDEPERRGDAGQK